ncbi:MAG: hypothetical protein CMI98_05805, partial [Pelagibacteraceae bacterium]|nr:hypothetical protein [Pelagibacteraceae bacterium]
MKKLLLTLLITLFSSSLFAGFAYGGERFIPLELFTGGEIRSDTEIKFSKANLVFGDKNRKKIIGPEDWKHPNTGEKI